ncbi:MAG TPA: DUF4188 domain-containing protein [Enhygromyxa sp.]|nr:DUF4188 domain-containing protein [Enhygromyxa sp.]
MSEIIKQKITAQIEGEPVVFLTGMRINKWWKLHLWLPVLAAAIGMQRSLDRGREHGLLGQDAWLGRNLIIVQYWRSYDALERWARNKRERHLPAWLAFVRRIGLSGDVGIWHETYRITPDNYETIYVNMPPFGLAKATQAVAITSRTDSARARMGQTEARAMVART